MARTRKRVAVAVAVGALVAAGAALGLLRRGVEVEAGSVARAPVTEWVEGTGKARVRERHVISAPAAGALQRVEVHAGDAVRTGDPVARVLPPTPAPLDPRTRSELRARLGAARAAEAEADAALRRARVAEEDAGRALARARALLAGAALPIREHEANEAAERAARESVAAARATVARTRAERAAVEALLGVEARARGGAIVVDAPVAGVVLRVLQESPGPVQAGTPLLEVGDPRELEVALELLTEQAARIRPGAPVEVGAWGGDRALRGVVRRIEPSAFTKVSALGVEEQRVLVLVDPAGDRRAWAPLGDGWRVEGRVAATRRDDALTVPPGALFRGDAGWTVFAIEGGRARLRPVRIGAAAPDAVEIVDGLAEREQVVLRPTSELRDGARVRVRVP